MPGPGADEASAADAGPTPQSVLPAASFVKFEASRLRSPRVVWRNDAFGAGFAPMDHAYCMPMPGESADTYLPSDRATYLGERYGGGGIGRNGGGVRCGLRGDVQVKGIGRNPLAGDGTDPWHSHGGAVLEEGIREAVWGEVCEAALPFGGVRTLAIILTGTTVVASATTGPRARSRALIVREAALRPAHFIRAHAFRAAEGRKLGGIVDTHRTAMAVLAFEAAMHALYGDAHPVAAPEEALARQQRAMASRFARQIAASQARRIFHGGLSSSNICLDGRWIDYGTPSTVSDYGRVIIARGMPDQWMQHAPLLDTLRDLNHALRKFLPRGRARLLLPLDEWLGHFAGELHASRVVEFAMLCGFPQHDLAGLPPGLATGLYTACMRIVSEGNGEPFKLSPAHVADMPAKMGRYSLTEVITVAAAHATSVAAETALRGALPDRALREGFVQAYWALRDAWHARGRCARADEDAYLHLSALRSHQPLSALYRPVFDRDTDAMLAAHEGAADDVLAAAVTDFIEARITMARRRFRTTADGSFDVDPAWLGRAAAGLPASMPVAVAGAALTARQLGLEASARRLA